MSLKIFHTSDLHLGMKFAGYPEVQKELTEARFKTLEKLVKLANSEKCDLFIVTGDLFESVSIAKRDVIRSAQILSEFQGNLVVVLPGNHDFISKGQTDLWTHFKDIASNNIKLLEDQELVPLSHYDLDIMLYPAPCDAKHSSKNYLGWIKGSEKDSGIKFHIGIAHGSLDGFSIDFDKNYYPMTVSELQKCDLDLWLLGHTHVQHPVKTGSTDKIFYPGTPEPDGFDCQHEGKAWILEITDDKKITATSLSTGIYKFTHDEVEVSKAEDIYDLKGRYASSEFSHTLLKLKLKGRLPRDDYQLLPDVKKALNTQLLHLILNDDEITEEITLEIIDQEFTEGSFPYKLLSSFSHDTEALQVVYELINEAKK